MTVVSKAVRVGNGVLAISAVIHGRLRYNGGSQYMEYVCRQQLDDQGVGR